MTRPLGLIGNTLLVKAWSNITTAIHEQGLIYCQSTNSGFLHTVKSFRDRLLPPTGCPLGSSKEKSVQQTFTPQEEHRSQVLHPSGSRV
ncbi:flavin oxidoreductase nadh oxidase [Moniliophthora roreri]|nr:flavin oxidoreductase nadh oxidase [Moniliophthora roreri]